MRISKGNHGYDIEIGEYMNEQEIVDLVLQEIQKKYQEKKCLYLLDKVEESVRTQLESIFRLVDINDKRETADYVLMKIPVLDVSKHSFLEDESKKNTEIGQFGKEILSRHLITEDFLKECHMMPGTKIKVDKKSIVTPLAHDYMMEHEIELIRI